MTFPNAHGAAVGVFLWSAHHIRNINPAYPSIPFNDGFRSAPRCRAFDKWKYLIPSMKSVCSLNRIADPTPDCIVKLKLVPLGGIRLSASSIPNAISP
jgi:hypothetical protein